VWAIVPTKRRAATAPPDPTDDGFRFICRRDGDRVRVFSRRGHDWTDRVPAIAEALQSLRVKSVTLDGEGVVSDIAGASLSSARMDRTTGRARFRVFLLGAPED
jgi:ATP-dependent DNA ligase